MHYELCIMNYFYIFASRFFGTVLRYGNQLYDAGRGYAPC